MPTGSFRVRALTHSGHHVYHDPKESYDTTLWRIGLGISSYNLSGKPDVFSRSQTESCSYPLNHLILPLLNRLHDRSRSHFRLLDLRHV